MTKTNELHEWAKAGDLAAIEGFVQLMRATEVETESESIFSAEEKNQSRPSNPLENFNTALNALNKYEETPFIIALKYNQKTVINYLFKNSEIDVHQQCRTYATPLVAAVYFQNLDATEKLISLEKKLKGFFDSKKHPCLLLTAIRVNNTEIIKYLLKEQIDINDPGGSSYDESKRFGFDEFYDDPTPFDLHGTAVVELPVIVALQEHKVEALAILLSYKPDMDKKIEYSYSANELIQSDKYSKETYEKARMLNPANCFFSTKTNGASVTLFASKKSPELLNKLLKKLSSDSTPLDVKVEALEMSHLIGVELLQEIGGLEHENIIKRDQILEVFGIFSQLLKEKLHSSVSTTHDDWVTISANKM